MRRIASIMLMVAVLLAGAAGSSSAHVVRYSSGVAGFFYNGNLYELRGSVSSELHGLSCLEGRTVKLYDPSGELQGLAVTEGYGFTMSVGLDYDTRYQLELRRKVIRRNGHRHVCSAARNDFVLAAPES